LFGDEKMIEIIPTTKKIIKSLSNGVLGKEIFLVKSSLIAPSAKNMRVPHTKRKNLFVEKNS